MRHLLTIAAATALVATPAAADVRAVGPDRFEVAYSVDTALDPDRLYALLGQPSRWWSDAHTYSGKAANLRLELKPTGCWCEAMPGGERREHLVVGIAEPGRRLLLMGLLGPLKTEAQAGTMIWTITPTGAGSTLAMTYKVVGLNDGRAAVFAPAVDAVLGEQVQRLQKTAGEIAVRR
ncbi:ATPase [Sphingomonas humi]|uniref:SRPBCC family protein n=1 Tax=Sphingomonas humi TaxID=335630 RepID=A0ABP7RUB1_9SPHN